MILGMSGVNEKWSIRYSAFGMRVCSAIDVIPRERRDYRVLVLFLVLKTFSSW